MEELTKKLNAFYLAYKTATDEEEKNTLYKFLERILQDIVNLIMDV